MKAAATAQQYQWPIAPKAQVPRAPRATSSQPERRTQLDRSAASGAQCSPREADAESETETDEDEICVQI